MPEIFWRHNCQRGQQEAEYEVTEDIHVVVYMWTKK